MRKGVDLVLASARRLPFLAYIYLGDLQKSRNEKTQNQALITPFIVVIVAILIFERQ